MRQFPQSAQLDHMLSASELDAEHMEKIALMVADFHQTIQVADDAMDYGNNDAVYSPVEENFTQINVVILIAKLVTTPKLKKTRRKLNIK